MPTGLDLGHLLDASWPLGILSLLALASCLYTLLAVLAVRAFPRENREAAPTRAPSVTLLKPLYGAEPG